jgi:DNA-binding MarR family transcriptional regulator
MTRLVDGMESRGWVTRKKAENDARRVLISLTGMGRKEARRLVGLTERSICTVFEQIPSEEHEAVKHSIHLLRRAVEQTRTRLDCC